MEQIGNIMSRTAPQDKTPTFRVQEFFMDASYVDNYTQEKRENFLKFQVTGKNIEKFAEIPDGARVKITFSIRGRFYDKEGAAEKGHGQNLDAYKFEVISKPGEKTIPPENTKDDGIYN